MANANTTMTNIVTIPYIEFPSMKNYASAVLGFENPRTYVKVVYDQKHDENLWVLEVDGDVKDANGDTTRMRATCWGSKLATEDEMDAFGDKRTEVSDACAHWGFITDDAGEKQWAKNPKLYNFVTLDGELIEPAGENRPYHGDADASAE